MIPEITPFQEFQKNPAPETAIALAIADHRAGRLTDWPFVDQLRKAEERVSAYPKLVEALKKTLPLLLESGNAHRYATDLLRELGEVK